MYVCAGFHRALDTTPLVRATDLRKGEAGHASPAAAAAEEEEEEGLAEERHRIRLAASAVTTSFELHASCIMGAYGITALAWASMGQWDGKVQCE